MDYKPAIIVATPGRLWELINERNNKYLKETLPLMDVLVLDEADRMIEDGHFKELEFILGYIYSNRVQFKKDKITQLKNQDKQEVVAQKNKFKEQLVKVKDNNLLKSKKSVAMTRSIETKPGFENIDFS